jgi:uncharacterized RDD family membrane protein YckC
MENAPAQREESVAPPGWTPSVGLGVSVVPSATPEPTDATPRSAGADTAADAAIRWRISAAVLDSVLLYVLYAIFCAAVHWRPTAPGHLLLLAIAGVVYHLAFEARDGQTPGKRRYGIRVVGLDGSKATPGAVALRSVLRLVDGFPVLYVSGLVSMVRTGPRRRQRIGDVAARTMVVAVDGQAAAKGTPGWMLPAATIAAVLVAAVSAYAVFDAGNRPLSSAQEAEFVAGCERSPGSQVVDCRCFLAQLEAAGYNSPNSLRRLMDDERAGLASGVAPAPLAAAARACVKATP